MRYERRLVLAAWLGLAAFPGAAGAGAVLHVTDGMFTSPGEWAGRPTVSSQQFAQAGVAGGAKLYVEQSGNVLYLMYDVNVNPIGQSPASFFDVFFQVPSDGHDYLVRINPGQDNFLAFEKPAGVPSNILPDGSFDVGTVWTPLSLADLELAKFHSAIGFNPGPDNGTPHLMAEFDLTIGGSQPGLYSPEPAFWSAGVKGAGDPPISSAIFTLNPDGTTTVVPVLGPDGGPIAQPAAALVPEPATLALAILGGLCALGRRWSRRGA